MSKGAKAHLSDAEPGNHAKISAGLGFLGIISCFGYESLLSWVTVSAFVAGIWLSYSHLQKYKKQRGLAWVGFWLCILGLMGAFSIEVMTDKGGPIALLLALTCCGAPIWMILKWLNKLNAGGQKKSAPSGRETASRSGTKTKSVSYTLPDLTIHYVNSQGKKKIFHTWRDTMKVTGDVVHINAAPEGHRVKLLRKRIVELQRKQIVELLRKRTLDSEELSIKTSQEKPPEPKPEGPPDVTIMYTNFQGETKAFSAWRSTIKVVNNHLSACVAPSGQRIALAIDRIGNLEELGDLPLSQPEVDKPEATESAPEPREEISRPVSLEKPVPKVEGGWRYIPIVSYSFSEGQVKARQVGTRLRPDFETSIEFIYINHRGEPRVFKGNRFTLRDKGLFYSLVVEPKNRRIALKKERIRNLDKHSPIPSRTEIRQIIKTLRRGTTNAQYEALQKQYPDWCPALPTPKEARVLTYHATRGSTSPLFEQIKAKFTSPTEEEDITPEIAEETIVTQPEPEPESQPVPEPEPEPEPATMNVVITGCGMSTYDAQKILQELKPDLRFYDLYKLLRNFPQVAFENLPPQEAQAIKARLEAAGCTVELK